MKTKKIIHTFAFSTLFLALSSVAYAQGEANDYSYVKSSDGQIVRSGFNLCWQDPYSGHEAYCDKKEIVAQNDVPVPPPPAPAPVRESSHYDATVLFHFDSYQLTNDGKAILDDLVAKTKQSQSNGDSVYIEVIGHTDRFGSDSYNQRLSEKRANTVAKYLEAQGVFTTNGEVGQRGVGKANPVVECHKGSFAADVKCLQPNRRVHAIVHINEDGSISTEQ
jgi:OmpA-OmpF porin, OOP family